jgi:hypothetical protein
MDFSSQVPSVALLALFIVFSLTSSSPGMTLTVLLATVVRILSLRNMVFRPRFRVWDVVNAVVSHTLLFSSLYILLETEYSSLEPSGTIIDSLYYSMDTLTTNGGARVIPVSGRTKLIHIVNLLDTYLLFVTIGFYLVQYVKSPQAKSLSLDEIPGTV